MSERQRPPLHLPDTPYWTIPGVERIVVRDLSRVRLDHEAAVLAARHQHDIATPSATLVDPAAADPVTPARPEPSERYSPAFRSFLRLLWSLN